MKKNYINEENMIYFASRNHPISQVKKIKSREIIGAIFRFAISLMFNVKISDTQCGFKLYKANIAKKIFSKIKTNGYMHDLEICIISKKMNYVINELPVIWKHKFEGKISFFKDSIKIISSLVMIKFYSY
jgi:dolichyl-phosphate beta-glucosyltransferase